MPAIPKPLAGLLGRLGAGGPLGGDAKAGDGAPKGDIGMKGEGALGGGSQGEAEVGPDGQFLLGRGFGEGDRRSNIRNSSEKANVNQFLSELRKADTPAKKDAPSTETAPASEADIQEGPEAHVDEGGGHEAQLEQAVEEGQERYALDGAQAEHEAAMAAEAERETSDAEGRGEDPDGQQGQHEDSDDEEDRPGAGWLAEEQEEREKRRRFSLEGADLLGSANRCRCMLPDGTRCLRKPLPGTPYCREHRFSN